MGGILGDNSFGRDFGIGNNPVLQVDPTATAMQAQGPGLHWFTRRNDDPYVYHGTDAANLPSIQQNGLNNLWSNYFAADPLLAMRYAFRNNLHTKPEFVTEGDKKPGLLLRALKETVVPGAPLTSSNDFWKTGNDVPPAQLDARINGQWINLLNMLGLK